MLARKQVRLALMISGLLILVVLLASSLNSVRLRAGTFAPETSISGSGGAASMIFGSGGLDFILVLIVGAATLVGLYFIVQDKKERRALIGRIVMVVAITLVLNIVLRLINTETPTVNEIEPIAAPTTSVQSEQAAELLPPPEDAPAEGVALLLGAVILIAAGLVGWLIWRRFKKPAYIASDSPLDRLGQEARAAADALEQGAEIKDVVLRCYRQMGDVLDEARGLRRKRAMTPREFEEMLVAAGLPSKPVQRLTRLFEVVRYSAIEVGTRQQQEAISSLIAIAEACGIAEIDGQAI